MADLHIRTLGDAEVRPVLAIWNRVQRRDPITEMRFVQLVLADPDYWPGADSGFFVAVAGGAPVGFCRAIIRRGPNDRLGLEPDLGWISLLAVDEGHQRSGVGSALVRAALDYFARHGRKQVWVCGTPTSAPGSFVPGVDEEAYPGALRLFAKFGFVVDQPGYSMAREIVDFDVDAFRRDAWAAGPEIEVTTLTPDRIHAFFSFVADALPGAWNVAARAKVRTGALHEMLVASCRGEVVGYCQWTGEHFGPFGVVPQARNQRVGAKLFTEAVQRIREADGRTVWFNWADGNAARFYRRFGLHETRRFSVLRKDLK
jgi:mycothiol synthase